MGASPSAARPSQALLQDHTPLPPVGPERRVFSSASFLIRCRSSAALGVLLPSLSPDASRQETLHHADAHTDKTHSPPVKEPRATRFAQAFRPRGLAVSLRLLAWRSVPVRQSSCTAPRTRPVPGPCSSGRSSLGGVSGRRGVRRRESIDERGEGGMPGVVQQWKSSGGRMEKRSVCLCMFVCARVCVLCSGIFYACSVCV